MRKGLHNVNLGEHNLPILCCTLPSCSLSWTIDWSIIWFGLYESDSHSVVWSILELSRDHPSQCAATLLLQPPENWNMHHHTSSLWLTYSTEISLPNRHSQLETPVWKWQVVTPQHQESSEGLCRRWAQANSWAYFTLHSPYTSAGVFDPGTNSVGEAWEVLINEYRLIYETRRCRASRPRSHG